MSIPTVFFHRHHLWVAAVGLLWALPAAAQEGGDLIEAMAELEEQLNQLVVTGTKSEKRVSETPAVVTVLGGDDLRARGCRSLAEALRTVPGFYDVYDLTTHNVGIRGVNGGARASGSVLKLMIDGQAVSYRPSTGNFFGEELVPLAAVERIEVVRGPGSALYGANAFLGVVNVITRSGKDAQGAHLSGTAGASSYTRADGTLGFKPSGGGGVMLATGFEGGELLVAAEALVLDRSGLGVPEGSPARVGRLTTDRSRADLARPKSLFAKASVGDLAKGRATLLASVQHLEAGGQFQEYGPLLSRSLVSLMNQTYRLAFDREFEKLAVRLSASYFDSSPTARDQLDIGEPESLLVRNVGTTGFELAAEARFSPLEPLELSLGADFTQENHLLQSYDRLLTRDIFSKDGSLVRTAGTLLPGENKGQRARFRNLGAFLQGVYRTPWHVGITAGARLDDHTIYGAQFSPRLGLVWSKAESPLNVKVLYGTSFKPPSAEQLYTQAMRPLDLRGACQVSQATCALSAQSAQTGEIAASYRLGERAQLNATLFVTALRDRVEFVQEGSYLTAKNTSNEYYTGGELEAWVRIAPPLSARAGVGLAKLIDRTSGSHSAVVDRGQQELNEALFPTLQAHLALDYRLPWLQLRCSPEVSFIGPRPASQSNALEADGAYTLGNYFYTALSLSLPEYKGLGERAFSASLRIENLIGADYADPGFGGIDVPGLGRSAFLTVTQQL